MHTNQTQDKSKHHSDAWARVKEAMRRDWEQTKQDLALSGGHELNQGLVDTVKQAVGKEAIPRDDKPVPPRVIGEWEEAELPLSFGFGAVRHYRHRFPVWTPELEALLEREWEYQALGAQSWSEVRGLVRHGYTYGSRG